MKADEMISKAELFANDFIKKLSDSTEQPERKQVYFLDNQDELKKYMGVLQKIVNSVNDGENTTTDEDMILVDKASKIIADLKTAVSNFQKELIVNPDATEEDTTAVLSEDTISDAMKSNKTTQEITKNMNAIAEQQKASSTIAYNYALVCDGQINMFLANTKDELNNMINSLANNGNYKDIQLFKMSFTLVPLHKKTVLSV